MSQIFIDKRLVIGKSHLKGAEYGVFSSLFIPANTLIEVARTLKLKNEHVFITGNILTDYVFKLDDAHCLIAFGFGSLYNHNEDPSVNYKVTDGKIYYKTLKDIFPGDELYVSYGKDWWNKRNIKPI